MDISNESSVTVTLPKLVLEDALPDKALRFYVLAIAEPATAIDELATKIGCTVKYAQRLEKTLVDRGYLAISRLQSKEGTRQTYVFPPLTQRPELARAS